MVGAVSLGPASPNSASSSACEDFATLAGALAGLAEGTVASAAESSSLRAAAFPAGARFAGARFAGARFAGALSASGASGVAATGPGLVSSASETADLRRALRRGRAGPPTPGSSSSVSASTVSGVGAPETCSCPGMASSIPRLWGSKACTTSDTTSPLPMTSRALRGAGSPIAESGT